MAESRVDKALRGLLGTTGHDQRDVVGGQSRSTLNLAVGERIILDEGKCGWHETLVLTNKRLLLLNKDAIEYEIPLETIVEAYADTEGFTNLTKLRIKTSKGASRLFTLKVGGVGLLMGGDDYITQKSRSMVERYVSAINRAVDSLPK